MSIEELIENNKKPNLKRKIKELRKEKYTINVYKRKPENKPFFYGKRDYNKMADNEIKKINYKLKNKNKLITK